MPPGSAIIINTSAPASRASSDTFARKREGIVDPCFGMSDRPCRVPSALPLGRDSIRPFGSTLNMQAEHGLSGLRGGTAELRRKRRYVDRQSGREHEFRLIPHLLLRLEDKPDTVCSVFGLSRLVGNRSRNVHDNDNSKVTASSFSY